MSLNPSRDNTKTSFETKGCYEDEMKYAGEIHCIVAWYILNTQKMLSDHDGAIPLSIP